MSRVRAIPAILAVLLLAAVWSPLVGTGFAAHMMRHMALVALVPPLALAAWPDRPDAAPSLVLGAAAVEFAVVWGWHLPAMHHLARSHSLAFAAEQGSFLVMGVAVWSGALAARAPLAGAGGLLLTSMHMTLLGALLILAPRDLYGHGAADLAAQQLGGLVMLGIGTPAYLLGGLWLTARALRTSEEAAT